MTKNDLLVSIVLGPPPSTSRPITEGSLRRLAAARSDMALRQGETGSRIHKNLELIDPRGIVPGVLTLIDGRLEICNPDKTTLAWMIDIAQTVGGRVGDNLLRTYKSTDETFYHPDDESARQRLYAQIRAAAKIDEMPRKARRRWLAPLLISIVVIIFLTISWLRKLSLLSS